MVARTGSQPWNPTANAKMPAAAVMVTWAIDSQSALASASVEPISSRPCPLGSSTKMKGTRNAGMVYFQHCMVVLYGSPPVMRSEEHTSELQSLMRISYAVFCLKKKTRQQYHTQPQHNNQT